MSFDDARGERPPAGPPPADPPADPPTDPWQGAWWSTTPLPRGDPWTQAGSPAWPPAPPPPTDGVSIAAFVTALFGLVLAAVPLGIIGLSRTGAGRRRGRGFAVAGLVVSGVWVLAIAGAVVALFALVPKASNTALPLVQVSSSPATAASPTPVPPSPSRRPSTRPKTPAVRPRQVYIDELRAGQCLDTSKLGASVLKVPVVPCGQAHDGEVMGTTQLKGSAWKGDDAVTKLGDKACADIFHRYIGVDVDSSSYDYTWFGPTRDSWAHGDRLVVCVATQDGGSMTGSVKGVSV